MTRHLLAVAACATCLTALPAAAQFAKPEQAIKYRQSVLTVMGTHFGRVAAMAQGKAPFDAKAAADDAALVNMLAALPFTAFGPGTDKGAPTRAKPEVWTDAAFKDKAKTMEQAVAKFAEVAKGGDFEAVKASVGEVGKACKSCHDDFRAEKYSSN
jgi:cytochrome c556